MLVLADGQGGLFIVTSDSRSSFMSGGSLIAQRIDAGGFSAPGWPAGGTVLRDAVGYPVLGAVSPDGLGGALVSFEVDSSGNGTRVDVYAQRFGPGGQVSPGWPVEGVRLSYADGAQRRPYALAPDGSGGAYVAWTQGDDVDPDSGTDVLQHVLADGTIPPGWPLAGRPLVDPPSPPGRSDVFIVPTGDSGALVVFSDLRLGLGLGASICAQRVLANGTNAPGWPPEGRFLEYGPSRIHAGVPDEAGGVYVVRSTVAWEYPWMTQMTTSLWAHRFTFEGEVAAGWPADGILLVGRTTGWVRAAGDGENGLVLCWEIPYPDVQDPDQPRVFATRIAADGSSPIGWGRTGRVLDDPFTADTAVWPSVASDRAGGLWVAWQGGGATKPGRLQHRGPEGEVMPGWPPYGLVAAPSTAYEPVRLVNDEVDAVLLAWRSGDGYYAARFAADGPVAVALSLARSEAFAERIALEWRTSEPPSFTATLERSESEGEWRALATLAPDGAGLLEYEDRDVAPGRRYGYRLAWFEAGARGTSAEVWLETPGAPRLALHGLTPNPSPAAASVAFTLAQAGAARLEVLDVAGRRIAAHEVGSLGAGRHTLRLDERGPLAPGLYLLRLVTPGHTLTSRGVVTR